MIRGSAGGRETLKRYGIQHFKELGKRGIRATAAKYFNGSIADCMDWIRRRGYEHKIAEGVSEKLEKQLVAGAKIACEELPVILDPDNDVIFQEPAFSWSKRVSANSTQRQR